MNAEVLLKHFELIIDAPEAASRLRQLILDLAVRGKVIDYDTQDEPASDLLNRIRAEKARLTKAGQVRKEKSPPPRIPAETPYRIPQHWCWSQLAEIGVLNPRNSAPDDLQASFVPMPMIAAAYGIDHGHEVRAWGDIKSGYTHFAEGDVGLAKITPCFQNGKSAVLRGLTGGIGAGTTELHIIRPIFVCAEYILIFLKCSHFIDSGIPRMTGTAGQKRVPTDYFAFTPFPLPPLAEQHRIVSAVRELMTLCDRLEEAQKKREERRVRLSAATLARLATNFGEQRQSNAAFFIDNLSKVTARPAQIQQIKQTIRDLAVQGRLVLQNPTDERASLLLDRINAVKSDLIKDNAIKKDKGLWEGLPQEPPFPVPADWVWTRLQSVFEISRGGSPRPAGDPRYFGGPIPWITVGEITKDSSKYLTTTDGGLTEEGASRSRFINPGDLLLTNSGATLGVPKISQIRACMNDGVAVLRLFHSEPLNDFAYLYLQAQTERFRRINQGMGQPNLNTPIIAGWFIPLPPVAEQRRIVQRVDELMALCDRLEEQLTVTKSESRRLLEAVLDEALSGFAPSPKDESSRHKSLDDSSLTGMVVQ